MPNYEDEHIVGMEPPEGGMGSYTPDDYNPTEWEQGYVPKPPPEDGDHPIVMHLLDPPPKDRLSAVYVSDKGRAIAGIKARVLKPDGSPGPMLKDWFAHTYIGEGQRTSSLATVALAAGYPFELVMSPQDQVDHIKKLFLRAGESGIKAIARTVWVKSYQKLNGQGMPMYKDDKEVYVEVKGQTRIEAQVMKEAARIAAENGLSGVEWDNFMKDARMRTHMYIDPLTNEERSVRAEVDRLMGRYQGPG